ncbi:YlcI/YnfO family protein [Actinomycetospora termitidis]|uniref:YlcI/YnfO family protein n=1 Tax=Actinomycetospora termitidis TaxID=3053470 RepID=A0ABT7MED3_9PSEU|nr:YlcI/YnfO family protein [Actinomycetospora sp. Odt1-22]MDL5159025.1 YlcI/YnfO family protein [Actinomycetospora sp. Odt1-22]
MSEQMTLRLDDRLAAEAREAAAEDGTSVSDWVRAAIRYQLALKTALRARAEEDRRGTL